MTTMMQRSAEPAKFEVLAVELSRGPLAWRAALRAWEWARTAPTRLRLPMLGANVRLAPPISVVGCKAIRIGGGSSIWHHARLVALNVRHGDIRIDIGRGVAIHPYAHISAIQRVSIGDGALFASNVYITDHDHDWRNPNDPPISNGRVLAAPVSIGANVWLGERVCVLRGVTIGEGAIVGAGSVVTRSLPARCIAVGSPAGAIRQWDESEQRWIPVEMPS